MESNDLIKQLRDLPQAIADIEKNVANIRQKIQETNTKLAEREVYIVTSATAKEWGSNAEERKINQAAAKKNDEEWSKLGKALIFYESELVDAGIQLDLYINDFRAARSIAALMARG